MEYLQVREKCRADYAVIDMLIHPPKTGLTIFSIAHTHIIKQLIHLNIIKIFYQIFFIYICILTEPLIAAISCSRCR